MNECEDCSALFAPRPVDLGNLLSNYEVASYESQRESEFAARTYCRLINSKIKGFRGSVLDVGCGDGSFIQMMTDRNDAFCWGIEPSLAPVSLAPAVIRERIFVGGFGNYTPNRRFDLVTLFQTIEHLEDVNNFMSKAMDWLQPGGQIAVCSHDYRAWSNRLLGLHSPILDIEHLQIFSKESMTKLLDKHGFGEISVNPYWNRYPIQYWLKLLPIPSPIKNWVGNNPILKKLSVSLPAGNLLAIGRKMN